MSPSEPTRVTAADWTDRLRAEGPERDDAVRRLHELLVRVARAEVHRRRLSTRIAGPELDDIAEQAANDALVAVLDRLDAFRGESRFTTWAYKFVMFEVSTKVGRHFWRTNPSALDVSELDHLADQVAIVPHERVERAEQLAALRVAIERDLTDHQRMVFVAIALNDLAIDAVAAQLGAKRNAVYKTLFDARKKLRQSLASAGYPLVEDKCQA